MAGGKITRIAIKKSETDVDGNFDGFYKGLTMIAGDNNAFNAKTTNHKNPKKEPKAGKYFVKGWWTNHKNEPIKRAVYGQFLRFHIEMDKTYAKPGDVVYFAMFDSDMHSFGNDVVKADDPINLEHKDGSHKPYTYEKVNNENKVIIEFSTTDNLEKWTSKLDQDKIFELYFRCSYVNHGNTEHTELPYNFHDYLQIGTLVIDRFKMPGLNAVGDGIAEDMSYGTGHPTEKNKTDRKVYPADVIAKYKEEYKTFGFDFSKHTLFADATDDILYDPLIEKEPEPPYDPMKDIYKVPAVSTAVVKNRLDPIDEANFQIRLRNKNVKAIYTKEKIYNAKWHIKIPSTKYTPEVEVGTYDTGEDIKEFNENSFLGLIKRDSDYLFWDFKNTAELWFARGELQDNFDRLIEKFRQNKGGVYEHEVMTRRVVEREETDEYCQKVEDYIAQQLSTKFAKLEEVDDPSPYLVKGYNNKNEPIFGNDKNDDRLVIKSFGKPTYSYTPYYLALVKATDGLTVALNDIWSAEVYLKEVRFKGDDYTSKYEVTLWDHFGLDYPDMEKMFNAFPSAKEVFICWFVLQHLRGYKPFITKMTFTKEFKGNINQDKPIRPAKKESNINLNIPYEYGRIM